MPTLIGVVFFVGGLSCFLYRREWLLGLLMLSAFFQAASVVNLGSHGVQPYYLVALFYLASRAPSLLGTLSTRFPGKRLLITFAIVGIVSAILFPVLFAGTPVYSPAMSTDEGFFFRTPLQLGSANFVQAASLLLNVAVVLTAAKSQRTPATLTFYKVSFALLIGLVVTQFAASFFGIDIPLGILRNNPSYRINSDEVIGGRVSGTYTEAAGAGIALLLLYGGAFYEYLVNRESVRWLLAAALAIGLVRSSSSLAATALVTVFVIMFHPPFRSFARLDWGRLGRIGMMVVVAGLLLISPLSGAIAQYTTQKSDTLSYVFRVASDQYALELTRRTYGLGVGLGSNRPSSIITSLLSNVGVVGAIVFLLMAWRLSLNARGEDSWIRWALYAFILGRMFGGPDINEPQLWTSLALAASCASPWFIPAVPVKKRSWLGWFVGRAFCTDRGIPLPRQNEE